MHRKVRIYTLVFFFLTSVEINCVGCGSPSVFEVDDNKPQVPLVQIDEDDEFEWEVIDDPTSEVEVNEDPDILEIKEKMFIAQINDIFTNFDLYKDKTIIVEGMFTYFNTMDGGQVPVVYRKGPGCCGNDGWGGFLLRYDGELPNDNDWIRVVGRPVLEQKGKYNALYLVVSDLQVKEERGAEFVLQ